MSGSRGRKDVSWRSYRQGCGGLKIKAHGLVRVPRSCQVLRRGVSNLLTFSYEAVTQSSHLRTVQLSYQLQKHVFGYVHDFVLG